MRWFGEPWPSRAQRAAACQSEESHLETPVGRRCLLCTDKIQDGDRGEETPYSYLKLGEIVRGVGYVHVECVLRQSVGGPAHLTGHCRHFGGAEDCDQGLPPRAAAKAVWRLWTEVRSQLPTITVMCVVYLCLWIEVLGVVMLK